jgi:hypothetical protein
LLLSLFSLVRCPSHSSLLITCLFLCSLIYFFLSLYVPFLYP